MAISAVVIDTREPKWIQQLTFGGLPVVVTKLDFGDCMAATDDNQMLLIERKTVSDLLGSIEDGRIFQQAAGMIQQTRWSYVVITGELSRGLNGGVITDRGETRFPWASVMGALLTIQELGIFVTFATSDEDYEAAILRIGNRSRKEELKLLPAKFPQVYSAQEKVLIALPGIGEERVTKLLDYCTTPAWALVALTDPTTQIPGIPKDVKVKVRSAFKLSDEEQFVVLIDDAGREKLTIGPLGSQ